MLIILILVFILNIFSNEILYLQEYLLNMKQMKNHEVQNHVVQNNNLNQNSISKEIQCPYLNTIKRHLLDFDFQKVCCISLSNNNVYGCLICGRYFSGKGPKTPCYQHSIQSSHYLFINLTTNEIYCLPDNYLIQSPLLNDIKYNLSPYYTKQKLKQLYLLQSQYNVDGMEYVPGFVGMNNLGKMDFANTVMLVINVVKEVREYFLINQIFQNQLLQKIGLFFRKLWNNHNFKGVISPHQLFQAITQHSNKLFKIGTISDPSTFFVWLVNNLDKLIKKQKKKQKFSLLSLFQGQLKTSFIRGLKDSCQYQRAPQKVQTKNFIILSLQFPSKGIFNKTKNQTSLSQMMTKYSGLNGISSGQGLTYMRLLSYPRYLVLTFKRFLKTQYKIQKDSSEVIYNGTLQIVNKHYKLVAQICHQGQYDTGRFYNFVSINDKWFRIEDLKVLKVIKKDVILGQPYIQLYQLIA